MGTAASLGQGCLWLLFVAKEMVRKHIAKALKTDKTNFPVIRDAAATEHSLLEAEGWLCAQTGAGGDACTSPGSSRVLRMVKSSRKRRGLQGVALTVLQGSMFSQVSSDAARLLGWGWI